MSLETLRYLRLSGLRPRAVYLVTKACPKPQWRWLDDDPTRVYIPQATDVRAHDLRPLFGLPVTVILDRDGQEVARLTGGADWNSDSARAILAAIAASKG